MTASEFAECCGYQRTFVDQCLVEKSVAVDNLQLLAECAGFVDAIGQDEVQRLTSDAFAPVPELPSDYALQLLMQWEMADPRDRWRWTGELPPKPEPQSQRPTPRRSRPPEATVDAFKHVAGLGDPDRLAAWLRNHPEDAPDLLEMLEAA